MKWSINCLRIVLHFKYNKQAAKNVLFRLHKKKEKQENCFLWVYLYLVLVFCQKAGSFVHHQTADAHKFVHSFSITFARTVR